MEITQKYLDIYTDEIINEMKNSINKDNFDLFKKNFKENYDSIDLDKINYSMDRFVEAELDFMTDGNRGIGRLTENIPRLGAYFRDKLSILDKKGLGELENLIKRLIVKSYIFPATIMKQPENAKNLTPEELYNEWIPNIFTSNLKTLMSENSGNTLLSVIEKDVLLIRNFFRLHNMKGGGFLKINKIEFILDKYIVAGALLYCLDKLKTY